jgi:hypothetical protein
MDLKNNFNPLPEDEAPPPLDLTKIKSRRQAQCSVCQKWLINAHSLRRHMNLMHLDLRPFRCTQSRCNFACATYKELDTHLRKKHERPRPFPCGECLYKGYTKKDWANHVDSIHRKGGKPKPVRWTSNNRDSLEPQGERLESINEILSRDKF